MIPGASPPYLPAGVPFLPDIWSNDAIVQDQDGWAVFGQVDFAMGDNFILTLGARYTDETKDIDAAFTQNTPPGLIPDFRRDRLAGCQVRCSIQSAACSIRSILRLCHFRTVLF